MSYPEVIAGKYRLLRKLGQGGMGAVFQAEHLTLRSSVAIKLIDPEIATNAEALQRFLREAQSAASLRSPHVVQILDHGVDNGTPYIAMEMLDGESLADRLTRVRCLSPAETARVITHIARAIGRAHEAGIVHRDLKPDNVFLVRNDDEEIAKVLDFGIAKSTLHGFTNSASGGTRTGTLLGTPYYMSPEQAEGSKTVDARSDIWALGVIAYECLLGRRPFDEEALGALLLAICVRPLPVPSHAGPVPPGFDAWFARACERYLDLRFQSAKEAASDLRRVCGASSALGADVEVTGNFATRSDVLVPELQPHALANSASGLSATRVIGPNVGSKRASWAAVAVVICGLLAAIVITLMWKRKPANPSASASAALDSVILAPSPSAPIAPIEPSAPPALAAASPTTAEPAKPIVAAAPQSQNPKSKSAPSSKHPVAPSKPPVSEHANAPPQPKPGINLGL